MNTTNQDGSLAISSNIDRLIDLKNYSFHMLPYLSSDLLASSHYIIGELSQHILFSSPILLSLQRCLLKYPLSVLDRDCPTGKTGARTALVWAVLLPLCEHKLLTQEWSRQKLPSGQNVDLSTQPWICMLLQFLCYNVIARSTERRKGVWTDHILILNNDIVFFLLCYSPFSLFVIKITGFQF